MKILVVLSFLVLVMLCTRVVESKCSYQPHAGRTARQRYIDRHTTHRVCTGQEARDKGCQHGGTCDAAVVFGRIRSFQCNCTSEYYGDLCEARRSSGGDPERYGRK
ncbi:uncharacterized protein LOC144629869 isoform X2 [Oculina patagonica]